MVYDIIPALFLTLSTLVDYSHREVTCLAQNVYHEARGENILGQVAVAHVTLNRVADKRWPNSICDVVHQRKQFSWVSQKPPINNPVSYENSVEVALRVLFGQLSDPTNGATFFYNHGVVKPRWSRRFETVAVIGNHTFQR